MEVTNHDEAGSAFRRALSASGGPCTESDACPGRTRRAPSPTPGGPAAPHSRARSRQRFRWRSLLAVVLIVLGCVLAPVAGVSVWVHNQVSNTDRFVRTMSPLVDDPDVQNALTNRLTATVFQYVDVQGIADDAVTALCNQGLPPQITDRLSTLTPTLTSAVTGFVHDKIAELVASPQFASVWDQAITTAHKQMNAVLSGESKGVVVRGDTVY